MNNLHLCYNSTVGVREAARATSIFVPHKNRLDPVFQEVRQVGAEVLGYFNVVETPNGVVSPLWEGFYMGDSKSVPRWLGPDGKPRANFVVNGVPTTQLLDIRVDSVWVSYALDYLRGRMIDGLLDGVFLDVIGGKLWGGASGFDSWPAAERLAWQAGAVDFVRRLDDIRRKENPEFTIVNNNTWTGAVIAADGERYVNGVCIEGHDPATTKSAFVAGYIARPFAEDLGKRRVLTISKSKDAALRWAALEGVTHVCAADQDGDGKSDYGAVSLPVVLSTDLRPLEIATKVANLQHRIDDLRFDLAKALGERDAAIEQRKAAEAMYDQASKDRDAAANECIAAKNELRASLDREAAAAAAAYRLQDKLNQVRSIVS